MGAIESTIGRIKQMLVDGELRPGDKLPVEKDLAAGLGVSRNTLREAVRALTTLKVLQTRQGDGTYVTSLAPDLLLDGMAFVAELHGEAGELQFLHVRRLLEPEATALAVNRLTDAELAELRRLLRESHALVQTPAVDHERLMANDRAFHHLITARCGNPVLAALVENASGHTVRARMWRGRVDAGADARTVTEHQMIYQAIADRDSERARMLAAAHILGVEGSVRAMTVPAPDLAAGMIPRGGDIASSDE
ncbi:FadR/GntR family transcriptional regulator [Actinoplanes sp. NEAU-A12]|uniref:FadR/GntR family transcriptional regulator n=1 Tax=Actinoplanes sandaracinus TaxID=3045177 RepID=A0ABT6WXA1_9ACTN|nr:FadR/GntR family transcriptional regulator [Actinoplanes sandaracinus]MDI6104256.1 FadR/GntR family transcriptional regulator [Actinoplanes sandaracinus]